MDTPSDQKNYDFQQPTESESPMDKIFGGFAQKRNEEEEALGTIGTLRRRPNVIMRTLALALMVTAGGLAVWTSTGRDTTDNRSKAASEVVEVDRETREAAEGYYGVEEVIADDEGDSWRDWPIIAWVLSLIGLVE